MAIMVWLINMSTGEAHYHLTLSLIRLLGRQKMRQQLKCSLIYSNHVLCRLILIGWLCLIEIVGEL